MATSLATKFYPDLGLMVLRVCLGMFMAFGHGFDKLMAFSDKAGSFYDPFGIGSTASFSLVVFAEFFCAIAVAVGLKTRLACIPLITTMAVAAFLFHAGDPFRKQEMALLYLVGFSTIFLAGPGSYSVD